MALHEYWFHIGTRASFFAGLIYALILVFVDFRPEWLPSGWQWVFFRFDPSFVQCHGGAPLAGEGLAA